MVLDNMKLLFFFAFFSVIKSIEFGCTSRECNENSILEGKDADELASCTLHPRRELVIKEIPGEGGSMRCRSPESPSASDLKKCLLQDEENLIPHFVMVFVCEDS